jgi:hypothetical protein
VCNYKFQHWLLSLHSYNIRHLNTEIPAYHTALKAYKYVTYIYVLLCFKFSGRTFIHWRAPVNNFFMVNEKPLMSSVLLVKRNFRSARQYMVWRSGISSWITLFTRLRFSFVSWPTLIWFYYYVLYFLQPLQYFPLSHFTLVSSHIFLKILRLWDLNIYRDFISHLPCVLHVPPNFKLIHRMRHY